MREPIEAAGAVFVSCNRYDAEQRLSPQDGKRLGSDLAFSTRVLVDTTLALDSAILSDMRALAPDCIVADSMAIWGKLIAQKLGIPFVSSTTTFAFNRYSAGIMKQSPVRFLRMLCSMPKIGREIKRLQAAGYPIKNVLDIIQNDDSTDTIVYTSPEFQPCSDTFSADHYAFVGPSVRPAETRMEKPRQPLVYISLGTVVNDQPSFYRQCIAALADSPCRVILSVGEQVSPADLGALPQNVEAHSQVDQIAVLQVADVFLTHCGMNSVNEALYFGVPLVMFRKRRSRAACVPACFSSAQGSSSKSRTPRPSARPSTRCASPPLIAKKPPKFRRASAGAQAQGARPKRFCRSSAEHPDCHFSVSPKIRTAYVA